MEKSKLITEEQFWSTHLDYLLDSIDGSNSVTFQKGKKNLIMSNIIEESERGEKNDGGPLKINLTPENKYDLFLLYPKLKRAFDTEVPLKKLKTSFGQYISKIYILIIH